MRSEEEVDLAIERYSDMVRRICLVHLKNNADTEDIFQTVFLKYLLYEKEFANEEHEKAWFVTVTVNSCKDYLKSFFKKRTVRQGGVGVPVSGASAFWRHGGGGCAVWP